MRRECAFCPHSGKISGEHLWSRWIGELFPPDTVTFEKVEQDRSVSKRWQLNGLDMTANVVCKRCNETWMSRLEVKAKAAMSALILGEVIDEITAEQAHDIAIFAFKTAVIADKMMEGDDFFDVSMRYTFRESGTIPSGVLMWLLGLHDDVVSGAIRTKNIHFPNKGPRDLTLNVCSFFAGHFGFQVVSVKSDKVWSIDASPFPTGITIPFYPRLRLGVSWPRKLVLHSDTFDGFADRWDRVHYR